MATANEEAKVQNINGRTPDKAVRFSVSPTGGKIAAPVSPVGAGLNLCL